MAQGPEQELAQRRLLLALGANLPSPRGNPAETVAWAMARLGADLAPRGAASRHSALYQTPAFPAGSGPDYINAAMVIETAVPVPDALSYLHRLEARAGRARGTRWARRPLDIDLIAADDMILPDAEEQTRWRDMPPEAQTTETPEGLILPHPRVQDRAFVLVPLSEVAQDWTHPLTGQTVTQMCAALPADEVAGVRRIA